MQHSSTARYKNLVRYIRNWPLYFTRKFKKGFSTLLFITRGNRIRLEVPSKALYLVFKEIFVSDFYDINHLIKKLPANPVVLDIGANAGYFNMLLFSKLEKATVFAYEPIRSNYDLFQKNISLNPSLQSRIHLFNKAVTGTPQETVELFMETDADNSVIASVYSDFDQQNHFTIKVPAISLQQIFEQNNIAQADLVKIDCEGSEYPIIYETPAALWKQMKMLTIEVHNLDGEKRNAAYLAKFLEDKGYEVVFQPAHSNCFTMEAIRK